MVRDVWLLVNGQNGAWQDAGLEMREMKKPGITFAGMLHVVFILLPVLAQVETEYANGYRWTYHINDEVEAEICCSVYSDIAVSPTPTGALTIPSMLGGCPVTRIGDHAFFDCSRLRSVTIPDSVTSIGNFAFNNCSGLRSVTIPDSVTNIGEYAFTGCSGLTSVTIPDSVTSIESGAFSGCNGLTSVTIPDSVTSIESGAFSGCNGLTSVTIPDSITSIGDYTFCGCIGLMSIIIGNGVTNIGNSAFYGCTGLVNVTIPQCVCSSSMLRVFPFAYKSITNVVISYSVTSIGDSVFYNCSGLRSVTIPDSVMSIGNKAFCDCTGLASVTIPDSVTSIGEHAFYRCSGLRSVTIGSGVTSIEQCAFCDCTGLASVTIPDSASSIGALAFLGCSGLTSVTIGNGVTNIGANAFSRCSESLFDTITIAGVKLVDGWAVDYMSVFSGIGILDLTGVRGIGDYAFDGCTWLTSVKIPANVTSIGDGVFRECSELRGVYFEGDAPSVGSYAFYFVGYPCVVHVVRGSTGWGVEIPGTWNWLGIKYTSSVTVSLNANGGKVGSAATSRILVDEGKAVGTLPKATRKGYKLKGWYTKKSGGTKIKASTKVKKDVTYYARWTANKYKIKFNKNGGKGTMKTLSATYGKTVKLTANAFKRSKYKFAGWAKKKSGKVVYKNKAKVKNLTATNGKTVTLYAVWKEAKASSAKSAANVSAGAKSARSASSVKSVASASVPAWAVGTFHGGDEGASTTITVSKTGKVSGKVVFADGRWMIVGKANGKRIEAVVTDDEGNCWEVALAIIKKEDGSCRIESEDGSIWAE